MKNVRALVRISGRVQGVNFRYHTQQSALRHQLGGWVRNLDDGSVAAAFEGPESAVRAVLDWCRQGPPSARVDSLDISWEAYRGEFSDFRILR